MPATTDIARPRIKRIQFTLRSLWINFSIACVLLGFVADACHTAAVRREMLLRLGGNRVLTPFGNDDVIDRWYAMNHLVVRRRSIPLVRQFFGDRRIILIELFNDKDPATISRLHRYFPEAVIIVDGRQAL